MDDPIRENYYDQKYLFLPAKFTIPQTGRHHIYRKRLTQFLNENIEKKLTLVSAPAGFGKTTLLADWSQQFHSPVVWLTVDELDNDHNRFLSNLFYAFKTHLNQPVDSFLSMLSSPKPASAELIRASLLQQISTISTDIVLVLDELQQITVSEIYRTLEFMVERLPLNIHIIISTREDPRMPLARMRANNQIAELRAAQLQFQVEEAEQFFAVRRETPLSPETIKTIVRQTEGWAAGLQMAELSLRSHPDPSRLVSEFSSSNRYVMDFFIEEVWRSQPEHIRSFLLRTSILQQMNADICQILTGIPECQAILEELEQNNLFLTPLDQERRWYRYHKLFADLLQKRLANQDSDLTLKLHQDASRWFMKKGDRNAAIYHALNGKDYDFSARLILESAEDTLMNSFTLNLMNWIEAIPQPVIDQNIPLRIYLAWSRLMIAKPLSEIEACLKDISWEDEDREIQGKYIGLKALIASMQGNIERGLALTKKSLEIFPHDSYFFRSILIDNLGILQLLNGKYSDAMVAFEEAVEIGQKTNNKLITVGALSNIAGQYLVQGKLTRAASLFEEALDLSRYAGDQYLPIASKPLIGLGDILREWNELDRSEKMLKQGIELIRQYGEIGAVMGFLSLARIKEAQDDLESALQYTEKARKIAVKFDASTLDDRLVDSYRQIIYLAMNKFEQTIPWKEALEQKLTQIQPSLMKEVMQKDPLMSAELITLGKIYLVTRKPDLALDLFRKVIPEDWEEIHSRAQIRGLVQQALAYQNLGEIDHANQVFQKAVKLGKDERYMRSFLDEKEAILPLLVAASKKIELSDYVQLLKNKLVDSKLKTDDKRGDLPLREFEVLKLIALGYSNKQIAQSLYLAVDTVKGYTRKLYARLGAQNRSHAVRIAREQGILAEEEQHPD